VIQNNEGQSWDFRYDMSKAKSTASGREGNMYHKKQSGFYQDIHFDLDPEYIDLA